jgi:ribosomal protein L3
MDATKSAGVSAGAIAVATAAAAILPAGTLLVPALGAIVAALAKSQEDLKDAERKGVAPLEEEAKKQRVVMEFQSHQARVSQELAIAQRISLSNTVEIEEFYDTSGKGTLGIKADEAGITAGASGEGRRVTKRVIKFSGWGGSEIPQAEKA